MSNNLSFSGISSVALTFGRIPFAAMEGYNPTSLMHEAIVGQLLTFGGLMIFVTVIVLAALSAKAAKDKLRHGTIRLAIEKGQPLPAELLDRPAPKHPNRDRMQGLVAIAFGVGLFVFLRAVSTHEPGVAWIALIPILIGIALVVSWALDRREQKGPDSR